RASVAARGARNGRPVPDRCGRSRRRMPWPFSSRIARIGSPCQSTIAHEVPRGERVGRGPAMLTDPRAPLNGLRVLDASPLLAASGGLAGPFCGQVLGALGAEVLKVDRPGSGDETRAWGPPFAGPLSAYYLSCNRNKRSLTLDLGRPDGVRLFHELVRKSDVL